MLYPVGVEVHGKGGYDAPEACGTLRDDTLREHFPWKRTKDAETQKKPDIYIINNQVR